VQSSSAVLAIIGVEPSARVTDTRLLIGCHPIRLSHFATTTDSGMRCAD